MIHEAMGALSAGPKDLYTGDCRGCGECCSRILPLSERDIRRVRTYARKHKVAQRPERGNPTRGEVDMVCPYLTDGGLCSIYHARPDICRAYRCDLHVRGDFSFLRKFMRHHPYRTMDIRQVMAERGV